VDACAELSAVLDDRDLTGDLEVAQRLLPSLAELVDDRVLG